MGGRYEMTTLLSPPIDAVAALSVMTATDVIEGAVSSARPRFRRSPHDPPI